MRLRPGFILACPASCALKISIVTIVVRQNRTVRYVPLDGVLHWIAICQTSYSFDHVEWEKADVKNMHNLW